MFLKTETHIIHTSSLLVSQPNHKKSNLITSGQSRLLGITFGPHPITVSNDGQTVGGDGTVDGIYNLEATT